MDTSHWAPVYVGLGSNLDEPAAQIARAMAALAALPRSRLVQRSSLYRTPPFGPVPQPDFINAAAALLTLDTPRDFLLQLKRIEQQLGREAPVERWGPRRIDLDLLVHGGTQIDEPGITVPHRGIAERAFVLVPLAELAPELLVPNVGRVATLLRRVDATRVARVQA